MSIRSNFALFACALLAACSTSASLAGRPLDAGVSRTFAADFESVSTAVDAAIENLPVNIIAPFERGGARVARFDRPISTSGWGESGRIVIMPIDQRTTRVTVAVDPRDPAQPRERTEGGYAAEIFRDVSIALWSRESGVAGVTSSDDARY